MFRIGNNIDVSVFNYFFGIIYLYWVGFAMQEVLIFYASWVSLCTLLLGYLVSSHFFLLLFQLFFSTEQYYIYISENEGLNKNTDVSTTNI